jgi:hypothetical protein
MGAKPLDLPPRAGQNRYSGGGLLLRVLLLAFSLIAVLAGPLLREAEAAEDLNRSLAELGCPPLCEEADGGVGDESGSTILTDRLAPPAGHDASIPALVPAALDFVTRNPDLSLASRRARPDDWHPSGAVDGQDRLAWYQILLC